MVVERKGRARSVVDKESITDSERNQRKNFNTTSRFAALSDDHDAPTIEELVVQNPTHLAEPPDSKEAGGIDIRVNYEGDSQPVFGHEGEAIMSDDEDTVVQETPGVHEGIIVGLSA
ncbi:hypothetical protein WN943_018692 [Citrus x changshan-huyou]